MIKNIIGHRGITILFYRIQPNSKLLLYRQRHTQLKIALMVMFEIFYHFCLLYGVNLYLYQIFRNTYTIFVTILRRQPVESLSYRTRC